MCASTLRIVTPANGKIGRWRCTSSSRSTPQAPTTWAVKLFEIDAIGSGSSMRASPTVKPCQSPANPNAIAACSIPSRCRCVRAYDSMRSARPASIRRRKRTGAGRAGTVPTPSDAKPIAAASSASAVAGSKSRSSDVGRPVTNAAGISVNSTTFTWPPKMSSGYEAMISIAWKPRSACSPRPPTNSVSELIATRKPTITMLPSSTPPMKIAMLSIEWSPA